LAANGLGLTVTPSREDLEMNVKKKTGLGALLAAVFSVGAGAQEPVDTDEAEETLDEIIVVGTHIRGVAPDSSPYYVFNRDDILESGVSTAQDFMERLPQNFGGGSNTDLPYGAPNDSNSSFNGGSRGSFGNSVNLRGLGSSSTLVLLNGHRVAPSSGIGDFVDISMIPASALESIEVLTDGASSIYGGDAVAGVVNFNLRDDFEGVEASIRYGDDYKGDFDEFRASITGGMSWDSGNGLFVYEYSDQSSLSVADRKFSEDAPLPNDLLPAQERHSVLASVSQDLTPNLEVFSDLIFSSRDSEINGSVPGTGGLTGSVFRQSPSSDNLNFSAGGSWQVSDTWFVDISGTYSDYESDLERTGDAPSMRKNDSTIRIADAKASGTLLRMPGGDLKVAIGAQYRSESFTSLNVADEAADRDADRDVTAVFGEISIPIVGSDNAVSGIERLEVSVSGRYEDYSDFGSATGPKIGVLWSPSEALTLRSSYSESFNPPPLGRVGATDFVATALRTSFINTVRGLTSGDPSIDDVVVITAFGTSKDLKAEDSETFTVGLDFSQEWGRHALTVTTTWFDIEFVNRLGETPIPDARDSFDAPNIAFNSPELFPPGTVIFSPSQDEITDLVNSLDTLFANFAIFQDPFDAEIINYASITRNLTLTAVSGFDFDVAYTFESDTGTFSLGLNATKLQDFEQQAAVTTPVVEQVDTLLNPVGLKLRGRVGYAYNSIAADMFLNYVDDYRVDNTPSSDSIDSWTTVDVSLSYDSQEKSGQSILNNMGLRLSVQNLFDEDPPVTPGAPVFNIYGFDATNASPLGRIVSFELTKAF
jgi:outer membrane receptor protein involved in Fe transport